MKAVAYTHSRPIDDPDALLDVVLADPEPPEGHDLLVEVRAISVNPVDYKVRKRLDPAGEYKVLGFDCCGIVRSEGPDVRLFRPGDAVFYAGSIARPGTNSELHLVDERIVGPKPKKLSFAEAAAVPLTAITAWEALFDRLQLPRGTTPAPDEALLIIGGAGGVGSIATQLAHQLTGYRVVTTASRPETQDWARSMGAHEVLDHSKDLVGQARKLGLRFGHIFSTTHSDRHWDALVEILAPQGRICMIDDPEPIDVRKLKQKSGALFWELMFTRPVFGTRDMEAQHRILTEVSRMLDAGRLRSTLAENFGRIEAKNLMRAHALLESGKSRGKIVLEGF
jgi:NADPH2:quinone reductase